MIRLINIKHIVLLSITLIMLTAACENLILGPDVANTPVNNFNMLWKEFDKYYPSFIVKNINWDSLHAVYSKQVSNQITDDSLWKVVTYMLGNFNDPHVYMYNRDHSAYFSSSYKREAGHSREFDLSLIKDFYLKFNYKIAGEGKFIYGKISSDSIGYVYISTFDGDNLWTHDIDNIVSELMNAKSIILDVRNNRGGTADNCNYIAEAFIDRQFSYLMMKSRNGPGHNDFSTPLYLNVKPRSYAQQYTKKIVLLTNRYTASSAEVFSVIFKHLSYSTQIGDSTAGGLGYSSRSFELMNGWTYHMPEGLSLSLDGQSYEGIGIVPDIYVRNYDYEINLGYDSQLEYAIYFLNK